MYYFLQHSEKGQKMAKLFYFGKQFQKGQMTTLFYLMVYCMTTFYSEMTN